MAVTFLFTTFAEEEIHALDGCVGENVTTSTQATRETWKPRRSELTSRWGGRGSELRSDKLENEDKKEN